MIPENECQKSTMIPGNECQKSTMIPGNECQKSIMIPGNECQKSTMIPRGQIKFCGSPPAGGRKTIMTGGDFQNISRMIPANVIMQKNWFPLVRIKKAMIRTDTGNQNTVKLSLGCQNWAILGASGLFLGRGVDF